MRTTLRMSWRQVRRAKGRSVLIVTMLMLPVLALSFTAATFDMFRLTPQEQAVRALGAADAAVTRPQSSALFQEPTKAAWSTPDLSRHDAPPEPAGRDQIATFLPAGSRLLLDRTGTTAVFATRGAGIAKLETRALDYTDPLAAGLLRQLSGSAPKRAGQVALSRVAADRLGVAVGDVVRLGDGSASYTVVGLVERPDGIHDQFVVALPGTLPDSDPATPAVGDRYLADLPAAMPWTQVRDLNKSGVVAVSRAVLLDPPPRSEVPYYANWGPQSGLPVSETSLAYGTLVVVLSLLEVVLLAGPAFAVGARRRQRELALVGAAGGTPAQIRRIVLADGLVLGLVAAVAGVAVGLAAAWFGRPLVEQYLVEQRAGAFRVLPLGQLAAVGLAVGTGVIGALVPAFTAARVDLVQALSGRRGVTRSKRRWVALGLALVAGGIVAVSYATLQRMIPVLIAGLVAFELGAVLCTPALVGAVSKLGRFLPLAPRIALRDAARNRASAAPAIAAVMAAVAGCVALGGYLAGDQARQAADYRPSYPVGTVAAPFHSAEGDTAAAGRVAAALRRTLAIGATHDVAAPVCPANAADKAGSCDVTVEMPVAQRCPYDWRLLGRDATAAERKAALADRRCDHLDQESSNMVPNLVDDGAAVGTVTGVSGPALDRAVADLRAGKVLVTDARLITDGTVTVLRSVYTDTPDGSRPVPVETRTRLPAVLLPGAVGGTRAVLPPQVLGGLGLLAQPIGLVGTVTRMPDTGDEDRARAALRSASEGAYMEVERGTPAYDTEKTQMLIVLMLAACLVTLGAAWIATGLAAADGRADLSTLGAVGASPGFRRRLSLSQAGVIAILGGLLGSLVGLGMMYAVLFSVNESHRGGWPASSPLPLDAPWPLLGLVVLAVPVLAMTGAGLLTRSRLPIERRIT
ncbi:FtsX-like permease family protein [Longispora fulva]|uniref:FtsX-like permease family protein n=1 Tax=Longispora fulva TaxID=619741 RepID=UPI0018C92491|nr:FtsX-like permease family protein [Longispora fulva]